MQNVSEYLKAQAAVFLKKEDDWTSKHVHEKRVSTRRLRMALWWLEKASGKEGKPFRKARRDLGKLGRVLGERRQWDVLFKDAKKYEIATDTSDEDRKKAGEAIPLYFKSHGDKTEKHLRRAIEKAESLIDPKASRPLKRLRDGLSHWLENPPKSKHDFHEARIALKKARYVMEALGLAVDEVKTVQDWLGEAHDLEILQETFGENEKATQAEAEARGKAQKALPQALKHAIEALSAV